ncbi:MAG: glycogen synthase GlgA [Acidobacteria bacterium]|uniref:Glycogen synthase n=1 Tax=Candidatus Polarisedimenticola svalbardensis TaxID=2886004 RepID=A0A8J6XRV3_9BACT|nr:glycogen synthase GlgA [Candidatus Polarisedimenticola svalbardensis]
MNPLRICFVSSEVAPFAKTGGLADVSSALPGFLAGAGHDVRVFMPMYGSINHDRADMKPVHGLTDIAVDMGGRQVTCSVHETVTAPGGAPLYLLDCPEYYHREALYGSDPDEHQRFAMLCRATLESCQRLQWGPDIIHCNDWHAALIPLYLRTLYAWDQLFNDTRTVLTIHNIAYQGVFSSGITHDLGMAGHENMFHREDFAAGQVNFLKTGILYADAITTVSETYAREIQTPEYGMGMEAALKGRGGSVIGILNGVDYSIWSPENDSDIPRQYSADGLDGKRVNRDQLLSELGLSPDPVGPVLGVISRLASQKGFDLMFGVLPEILAGNDVRLVVLGSGAESYESYFATLQLEFPGKVCFYRGFNAGLAHRIEAGSDVFLMPSRFEPCGLNQMYSMRYGTVPVVRKTGGLADTVKMWNPEDGSGTGFVFDHFSADGFRWALQAALNSFKDTEGWRRLMKNGMEQNYSWNSQGRHYLNLYTRLLSGRPVR